MGRLSAVLPTEDEFKQARDSLNGLGKDALRSKFGSMTYWLKKKKNRTRRMVEKATTSSRH